MTRSELIIGNVYVSKLTVDGKEYSITFIYTGDDEYTHFIGGNGKYKYGTCCSACHTFRDATQQEIEYLYSFIPSENINFLP